MVSSKRHNTCQSGSLSALYMPSLARWLCRMASQSIQDIHGPRVRKGIFHADLTVVWWYRRYSSRTPSWVKIFASTSLPNFSLIKSKQGLWGGSFPSKICKESSYLGLLTPWTTFEMKVLNCCRIEIWDPNEAIIFLRSQTPSNADLGVEHLLSGDENGSKARLSNISAK